MLLFGIFIFLRFNEIENASNSIKNKYPEIYKKHAVRHDLIDIDSLFSSNDFEKLKEEDLKTKLRLVKIYFRIAILSFFISIILGIIIVCI